MRSYSAYMWPIRCTAANLLPVMMETETTKFIHHNLKYIHEQ